MKRRLFGDIFPELEFGLPDKNGDKGIKLPYFFMKQRGTTQSILHETIKFPKTEESYLVYSSIE